MRVAVDAMGSDNGPSVVVRGVQRALGSVYSISKLYLVGDQKELEKELKACDCNDSRIEICHASQVLSMTDKPVDGLRHKKDCSIARATELVKKGEAQVLISAGNTGGVVAAAHIRLRPLKGVERPAIAAVIPARDNSFVLLDAGGFIDSRPSHLMQYGIMGSVYSREVLGYARPRVGVLNIGTEDVKGNELTHGAFNLLSKVHEAGIINFIGNVEGHDLFENRVDVVVCDGFMGNVVLKTCESFGGHLLRWIQHEISRSPTRVIGAMLAQGAFKSIKNRLDPESTGGAPILGLNGVVMKSHGSAKEKAIYNAIRLGVNAANQNINQIIIDEIAAAASLVSEKEITA